MSQTRFKITGDTKIHCASCEQRIGNALRRLDGVSEVTASAESQEVAVTIDDAKLDLATVRARLEQMGYQARREEAEKVAGG